MRLTFKYENYCSLVDCEGRGKCKIYGNCFKRLMYDKLAEYEDLEEQGLLLKLRWVKGFEGYYAVDVFGSIYSIKNNGQIIRKRKNTMNPNGYEYVNLKINGTVKNKRVHRIVADAFIPNPNSYTEVNHIDGDKTNNCVWNLEWCTKSYNSQHALKNGLLIPPSNYKDGVYKNGKNKFALVIDNVERKHWLFNSFRETTKFLKRGKEFINYHLTKGERIFSSGHYTIYVFDTREEAEQKLKEMGE